MKFTDTLNKQAIRSFDKEIIKHFSAQKGRKLSYFGLPGEKMLDILDWRDYLDKYVAIEYDDLSYSGVIFTALSQSLTSGLLAIKGDIDDILLGEDNRVAFPFDLVNLDYSGGAVYKDKVGEAKRLSAWENLFRQQSKQKHDFLLLLSLNSREKDEGEINEVLGEIRELIPPENSDIILKVKGIIAEGKKRDKFSLYIPYLITSYASHYKYKLSCCATICYTGSSFIPMMHFIFKLTFQRGRATPLKYSLPQIVNLPVYHCEDGEIFRKR